MSSIDVAGGVPAGTTDVAAFANAARITGVLTETIPRETALNNAAVLTSAKLSLVGVSLIAGQTVTNITFWSATTALSVGSNQWFALYSGALAKLAVTSDDTSTAWAANAAKTLALSTPYVVTATGWYFLGICVVATTVPTLTGITSSTTGSDNIRGTTPKRAQHANTGLTNPASAPDPAVNSGGLGILPYAYIT